MKPKQSPSAMPTAMPDGLDWDAYRIILMVGRHGSLSAAARHLGVDQATVGRKLKRAESAMSAKFFDRMNSGLFPTEAGQSIIDCAKQIEEQIESSNRQVLGLDQELRGIIRLSIPLNLMNYGLSEHIREFQKLYPEIDFEINATDETINFSQRQVDVVIRGQNEPSSGLWGYRLMTVNYSFVTTKDFFVKWQRRIETDPDTVPLPYIAMSSTAPERDENFLLSAFPNARRVACCSGMDTSIPLMMAGMGATRVANFMIPQLSNIHRLIACEDESRLSVWVLTLPDYRATKRIKLFMEFIRDQFHQSSV